MAGILQKRPARSGNGEKGAEIFDWLGIHDFSAGRHDYGCLHLIMAVVALCVLPFDISSFRNCSASGCSGAGWAIVIAIGIGFIPFMVAVVLLISELVSYHKMLQELKKDKTLKNHTIAMCCLGFILLLVTVALIILFAMPK